MLMFNDLQIIIEKENEESLFE